MTKTAGLLIAIAGAAAGYAIAKIAPQIKLAIEDNFASDGPDSDDHGDLARLFASEKDNS